MPFLSLVGPLLISSAMHGGNKNISACEILQGQTNPHYVEAYTNSPDNVSRDMQIIYLFKNTRWNCTFLDKIPKYVI